MGSEETLDSPLELSEEEKDSEDNDSELEEGLDSFEIELLDEGAGPHESKARLRASRVNGESILFIGIPQPVNITKETQNSKWANLPYRSNKMC